MEEKSRPTRRSWRRKRHSWRRRLQGGVGGGKDIVGGKEYKEELEEEKT